GATAWEQRKVVLRLIVMTRSHSSSGISVIGAKRWKPPAAFTSMSTPCQRSTTLRTMSFTSCARVASTWRTTAFPPPPSIPFPAAGLALLPAAPGLGQVDTGDSPGGALGREQLGDRLSQSLSGRGDDHDLSREPVLLCHMSTPPKIHLTGDERRQHVTPAAHPILSQATACGPPPAIAEREAAWA